MTQKEPRLLDPGFLTFLRQQRCCVCGKYPPVQAAHIRIGLFAGAMKPHDRHATPLCQCCHLDSPVAQHKMNEAEFWKRHRLDPFEIAAKFYSEYGGTGGKSKKARTKTKPRRPKERRQKIASRPFPKGRKFNDR